MYLTGKLAGTLGASDHKKIASETPLRRHATVVHVALTARLPLLVFVYGGISAFMEPVDTAALLAAPELTGFYLISKHMYHLRPSSMEA